MKHHLRSAYRQPGADRVPLQQVFENSGDGVFGIDRMHRITYVNPAFVQILGRSAEQMQGRPCHEVLQADDLALNRFCGSHCPIACEALQNQPMQNFDLVLTRSDGDRCWVNVGVYSMPMAPAPGEPRVYFALRRVNGHRMIQQLANELQKTTATSRLAGLLSPREREILGMAAQGQDTADISRGLSIAPQTVRNHFKSIFLKLEVRSRSQAVALALRQQLI